MKMHNDHPATCLCCQFADYAAYGPGYSEYTPSSPMNLSCDHNHFDLDAGEGFSSIHDLVVKAQGCGDYAGRDG